MKNIFYKGHEICEGCLHVIFKPKKLSQCNGSACSLGFTPRSNGYCKGKKQENGGI